MPSAEDFYPRSPCGERPLHFPADSLKSLFLSTLSLRRATKDQSHQPADPGISIHALLAESDGSNYGGRTADDDFYPRSPCGERPNGGIAATPAAVFLSTLSLRRATLPARRISTMSSDFYPRSPCGERQNKEDKNAAEEYFYPRSPCGERPQAAVQLIHTSLFLSTLSLRRATTAWFPRRRCDFISIHALLAESDLSGSPRRTGRQRFLSTLSLRRATY